MYVTGLNLGLAKSLHLCPNYSGIVSLLHRILLCLPNIALCYPTEMSPPVTHVSLMHNSRGKGGEAGLGREAEI